MPNTIQPGLIVLHSNQLEQLRDAVFAWQTRYPLGPLEQEIFLVQSNGIAEWLKIELARHFGVCAATRVDLPGRFLWTMYRATLGRHQIPRSAFLDKQPLSWRLMRLLPELLDRPEFAPLDYFLADGDPGRRLQLASRLADLMDSYQVYRTDWLTDWQQGLDQIRDNNGAARPLAADQLWQAELWRAILADLPEHERQLGRVNVHRRFVDFLQQGGQPAASLPRRVVVFGISALPRQTVEAMAALAGHTQVILAVPNPCQFFWGDIIEGREFFRSAYRRQQLRQGKDLAALAPEQLHAHSHPLLAGWGRLGRDFIRLLDEFDQAEQVRNAYPQLKIDLFTDTEGGSLLQQVQAAIRDLLPLAEHPHNAAPEHDSSIEFHVCHSRQREVEVLHDRLLSMLAEDATLAPRQVIVMVPDIARFSASIRAVFDQYKRNDPRYIPYEIGDLSERLANPVLVALDWLLRLPQQRCEQTELLDLLEVPALAARFGLQEDDLPRLQQWIAGSGIRWGLNSRQRAELGLAAAGEQNSWRFGLRRMLFGYAGGAAAGDASSAAYGEIGGLEAALVGSLASLLEMLARWDQLLRQSHTPTEWAELAYRLLDDFFAFNSTEDKLLQSRLQQALQHWLQVCADASYQEALPLDVFREPWLAAMEENSLNYRFLSGGVSFCSFMPMRSMPFQVVCMLGMNEGDFPRSVPAMDFDLLKLPGMQRPGDRSRRDDDRYLMLEALLAARQKLYISWVGRNIRDNSEQPPSVLVSQLRDYLQAGWQTDLTQQTFDYPLQPFSRRYFDGSVARLQTHAREWGLAYTAAISANSAGPAAAGTDGAAGAGQGWQGGTEPGLHLNLAELISFVQQPVRYFFQRRLQVNFHDHAVLADNLEPFGLNQLDQWQFADRLLDSLSYRRPDPAPDLQMAVEALARTGELPIGEAGRQWQMQLQQQLLPIASRWTTLLADYPELADKHPLRFEYDGMLLEDWLDQLRGNQHESVLLMRTASTLAADKKASVARADKLIGLWIRQLAMASCNLPYTALLLGRDLQISAAAIEPEQARQQLRMLLDYWRLAQLQLPPVACRTALAYLNNEAADEMYNGDSYTSGERENPYLARVWPEFQDLQAEPEWEQWAQALYQPLLAWAAGLQLQSLAEQEPQQ